jgi:hypothetical protein
MVPLCLVGDIYWRKGGTDGIWLDVWPLSHWPSENLPKTERISLVSKPEPYPHPSISPNPCENSILPHLQFMNHDDKSIEQIEPLGSIGTGALLLFFFYCRYFPTSPAAVTNTCGSKLIYTLKKTKTKQNI